MVRRRTDLIKYQRDRPTTDTTARKKTSGTEDASLKLPELTASTEPLSAPLETEYVVTEELLAVVVSNTPLEPTARVVEMGPETAVSATSLMVDSVGETLRKVETGPEAAVSVVSLVVDTGWGMSRKVETGEERASVVMVDTVGETSIEVTLWSNRVSDIFADTILLPYIPCDSNTRS